MTDEEGTSDIFLNPYNLWDVNPASPKSLKYTKDRRFISKQYPQTTTNRPRTDLNPVFSSLQTIETKNLGLSVSFAFFGKNYQPVGRVKETVAAVEELSDLWKPGARDGAPPFVMNCRCI